MLEVVLSVAAKVSEYLVAPVVRRLSYLCNYKSNFENLERQVDKLTDIRERVQHSVDDAVRNGEQIEHDVEKWLTGANKTIAEFIEDEDKAKSLWFKGLCPNLKNCYQLSKKANKEVKDVARLLQEKENFHKVSYTTVPEETWLTSIKGYEEFESRTSTLKNILHTLNNPNVNMLGVYGMGGIGKTTLVKEVARQAKKENLFDKVVFADVSQNASIRKIQGEIADQLGLRFHEESESGRARSLCTRLKNEKKILVILDNLWASLDLEKVGICFRNEHDGCKVLLTSRSRDVLSNDMDCQSIFSIGVLNEIEAWSLFKKMAGDGIENYDLQSVAIDVANKCAGLPIAIVTITRALKNKSLFEWKNALRQLRRPYSSNFTGREAVAYSTIELSYNHLPGEELKSTFLLCSLMVSNSILDLLKYGFGLGLFKGINTIEEARDRVHALLSKLKASCLLLDNYTSKEFSMHDVVRDVAISVASRDHHMFTVRNDVLPREWYSDKDSMKSCIAVALDNNAISDLPEELKCPQLKIFILNSKDRFFKVPDNFFIGMIDLKVLDLTNLHFLSMPSSLSLLLNLQTLCLDHCILGDLAIIGDLKKLEILSLLNSNIERLPEEISQLTQLKLLDLSNCTKLRVIPPNVISCLSRLEELYLGNTFVEWEVEGFNTKRSNASLDELKYLSQLTTLEIHIRDGKNLPEGLFSKRLERYKIFIGNVWNGWNCFETSRTLKLKLNTSICLEDEVTTRLKNLENYTMRPFFKEKIVMFSNLESLELCAINSKYLFSYSVVRNLVHLQHLKISCCPILAGIIVIEDLQSVARYNSENHIEFSSLKQLEIEQCPQLKAFILKNMTTGIGPFFGEEVAFPSLEELVLHNVDNLKLLWQNQLSEDSFCKLKSLRIGGCHNLLSIFPSNMLGRFSQLELLTVTGCALLEELHFEEINELNKDPRNHLVSKFTHGENFDMAESEKPQLPIVY